MSRNEIIQYYRVDEISAVQNLLKGIVFTELDEQKIKKLAEQLIESIRLKHDEMSGIEAFIKHYDLSTLEGIMLMCIAEALLRIPDKETENLLIRDKLISANWGAHLGKSQSSFVNISTWGLALTGKILNPKLEENFFKKIWSKLLLRSGEPIIRQAVHEAVRIMGNQFVLGRDITQALKNAQEFSKKGYVFSFDMLGEVARTSADADRYFEAYQNAIAVLASFNTSSGISVKLSALYPRYQYTHHAAAVPFLAERLFQLASAARNANIALTVDAEEADRLEMSLDIFTQVFKSKELADWSGLGLAVQAYQKRAVPLIKWLIALARDNRKRINVRLVKGAYWDTEIKLSQIGGYSDYPVFTRKNTTDLSYLACAKLMLSAPDAIYSQFATHNAYSVAAILNMNREKNTAFEFQSLQGMGRELHDQLLKMGMTCRIYAPVGSHEDLLPYLVRRLLENGANSSFVNQIANMRTTNEKLIVNPIQRTRDYQQIPNPKIPLPKDIFMPERINSYGIDLSHEHERERLLETIKSYANHSWQATALGLPMLMQKAEMIKNPADHRHIVGHVLSATKKDIDTAISNSLAAFPNWDTQNFRARAGILLKAADLLEKNAGELIALTTFEAGKTLSSGISEVREAVDFCRYYSALATKLMQPQELPGPTGEANTLFLQGRGPIVCISPWNFPIAIFCGQIAAALVTGNTVLAKPAEQTPLVAAKVVQLFHEAGIPESVLQLVPGLGETVGAALVSDPRIQGVIFTGSTDTARTIQKTLADRSGPIIPLIAETGGINALIADSSALPEQLVNDVLTSAFDSAGQRCSALRILFIQEEIADRTIEMLKGAMAELNIGNPKYLETDIGPVIDEEAKQRLELYAKKMQTEAKVIYQSVLPPETQYGTFIAPQAYEISSLKEIHHEVFGPMLHVIRYGQNKLNEVINEINELNYGLTFGIHSRIEHVIQLIQSKINAGNVYVNRNMIGAVVGVQPFGGRNLSGTGPKAGGPHYLIRLCQEKTLTINTTATGGNAALMTLADE